MMDETNDDDKNSRASDPNTPLTLRIKCNAASTSSPDANPSGNYEVTTTASSTVLTLKEAVRASLGQGARGRYLRLIAGGRLLAPDGANVGSFKIQDGDCVHAVLAAAGVRGGQQAALSRGYPGSSPLSSSSGRRFRSVAAFRRTGIGANGLVLPPPSSDDSDDDLESGEERLGFDRLRSTGLTRDEIAAIRLYFAGQINRFIDQRNRLRAETSENDTRTNNDVDMAQLRDSSSGDINSADADDISEARTNVDPRLERLRMEDEWMAAQGPTSEFRLNLNANNPLLMGGMGSSLLFRGSTADIDDGIGGTAAARVGGAIVGTDRDFFWGFILGFFVGFIMLFWVWMPTVPHKQKLGILTGISFQLALNLLRNDDSKDAVDEGFGR